MIAQIPFALAATRIEPSEHLLNAKRMAVADPPVRQSGDGGFRVDMRRARWTLNA